MPALASSRAVTGGWAYWRVTVCAPSAPHRPASAASPRVSPPPRGTR